MSTPESVLAWRLMPIASTSMPSAVRRTRSATMRPKTSQMSIGMGRPAKEPLPMKIRPGWLKVRMVPS